MTPPPQLKRVHSLKDCNYRCYLEGVTLCGRLVHNFNEQGVEGVEGVCTVDVKRREISLFYTGEMRQHNSV